MSSSLALGVWCALRIRGRTLDAVPTYSSFAWGFWWLNVVVCSYCTLYWALKRQPDGTPALLAAGGQMWVWQLAAAFVLRAIDASPWHLIWLALVSVAISIAIHKLVYNLQMNQRIRMRGEQSPEYLDAAGPAEGSPRPPQRRGTKGLKRGGQIRKLESLRQESRELGMTEVACKISGLLNSDAERDILYLGLGDHPALVAKLHDYWPYLVRTNPQPTPLKVSLMFSNMAAKLASEGEPLIALKCMECSLLFDEGGPEHWATQAEVFCALKDRSAAVYAGAVLEYKRARDEAEIAGLEFPHFAGHKILSAEYRRMVEITQICKDHAEWVDTNALSERAGIFR